MSEEIKEMSESEKKKEDWMNSKWRPMMGWMYMLVCFCDMVIFPVAWSILQTMTHQQITQWDPLTLRGAGLFHIAMGAVLGIAAYGRTQEKMAGANYGGIATPGTSSPTTGLSSPSPMGSSFSPSSNQVPLNSTVSQTVTTVTDTTSVSAAPTSPPPIRPILRRPS